MKYASKRRFLQKKENKFGYVKKNAYLCTENVELRTYYVIKHIFNQFFNLIKSLNL